MDRTEYQQEQSRKHSTPRYQKAATADALQHLESMLQACRDAELTGDYVDGSRCASFDRTGAPKDEASIAEARRLAGQVRIYLESWVAEPLRLAAKAQQGQLLTWEEQRQMQAWLTGRWD